MWKSYWLSGVLVLLSATTAVAQENYSYWPPGGRDDVHLINDLMPAPDYWMGIQCMPVPPPLRAQLGLAEDQGLLVESVVPDSPAAKAGILRHDILWSVTGKPLKDPMALIQAVETAKTEKLTLEVIRAGKSQTIEVTPVKRPEETRRWMVRPPEAGDWGTVKRWWEEQWGNQAGRDGFWPGHFRFFHPGAIVPQEPPQPMPSNMSVVISKEGDRPAKIVVKRGDEQWETTDKELDKLPGDVRPFVERMLGRGPFGVVGVERPSAAPSGKAPPEPPALGPKGPWPSLEGRLERRLQAIEQRVEQMMKSLEQWESGHKRPKAEEPAGAAEKPQTGQTPESSQQ